MIKIVFLFTLCLTVFSSYARISEKDSSHYELQIAQLINRVAANPDSVIRISTKMLEKKEVTYSPFFKSAYYNLLATGEYRKANFDGAQEWCSKAIELRQTFNYPAHLATSFTVFADILMEIDEYEKALFYLEKALKLKTEVNNPIYLSDVYCSIGKLYYRINEYDSSTYFYQQALEIYQTADDFKGLAVTHSCLANIKYELDALDEAIMDYKLAYAYYLKVGDEAGSAIPLMNIGASYEYLDELDSAILYYEKALYAVQAGGNFQNKDFILTGLADCYNAKGMSAAAIDMFHQYIAYSDSIFSIEKAHALIEADTKFKTREITQQLLLEQENSEKLAAQDANKRKTIFMLLAIALVIGLIVLFYIRNVKQRLKVSALENNVQNQKIDNLLKDQEAKSYAALLEGQSAERERIAQDLHDHLGGTLAAVKVHFSLMDQKISDLKSENRDLFNKVNEMLGDAVQDVRRISHDLASGRLSKLGLRGAISDLMDVLKRSKKMQVEFFMDENLPSFDSKREHEIYAVIQEIISNTLKHANAHSVDLQLNKQDDVCVLIFEDDGVGFNSELAKGKGLGLTGLANRVERMNGKLTIDSLVGRGTIIIIELPL